MIGDGPDRQKSEDLARNLGLYDDIRFLGKQEQISEILSIQTFSFCHPKRRALAYLHLKPWPAACR